MRNVLGNLITLTLFGESHGPCIGGVLDGLPAGLEIDSEYIKSELDKRKSAPAISTPRREEDIPEFLSGVLNGRTEGTPVAFTIANGDVHSSDYEELAGIARPGHADYSAEMRYGGFQDARGGGHFSGRLTAALVTAGAILKKAVKKAEETCILRMRAGDTAFSSWTWKGVIIKRSPECRSADRPPV